MLNATVHHEMLSPLKTNVFLAERLLKGPIFSNETVAEIQKAKAYV